MTYKQSSSGICDLSTPGKNLHARGHYNLKERVLIRLLAFHNSLAYIPAFPGARQARTRIRSRSQQISSRCLRKGCNQVVHFRLQVVGSIRSGMGSKLKEAHSGVFIMRGVWIICGGLTNTIQGQLQQSAFNE
jgi:hypothetical protein